MLKNLLEQKKCFKLICGAGNENLQEVEGLVAIYAAAGCHFFDICASEEVLAAAQKGLDFAVPKNRQNGEQKDYHFCISVGTKNDPHFQKAQIDSEKCVGCGKCAEVCPQKAIQEIGNRKWEIVERNCIGCPKCQNVCQNNAISFHISPFTFHSLLTTHHSLLTCIELHVSDEVDAQKDWEYLCENFNGMLSLCIGRDKFSNEKVLELIRKLVEKRKPYTTIIQADGSPMSGGEDDFKTTLQAVAMAEVINGANLPVYVLISGGTNSKTAELARLCAVDFNGIAVGSYARKIVKEYIERDDFLRGKCFDEAVKIAKKLIDR